MLDISLVNSLKNLLLDFKWLAEKNAIFKSFFGLNQQQACRNLPPAKIPVFFKKLIL
jgi:hypothetical protein